MSSIPVAPCCNAYILDSYFRLYYLLLVNYIYVVHKYIHIQSTGSSLEFSHYLDHLIKRRYKAFQKGTCCCPYWLWAWFVICSLFVEYFSVASLQYTYLYLLSTMKPFFKAIIVLSPHFFFVC
jgi:hypothetical protein